YKLYLVDAAKTPPGFGGNWDNYPLYIVDELTAYINGCLVGIEYGLQNRTIYSYKCVLEMWTYALYMQDMARESGFEHQKELDNFMKFVYNKRILLIKNQIELRNWYNRR